MRSVLLLLAAITTVSACTPNASSSSQTSSASSSAEASGIIVRPRAAKGEFCGGIAGIQCADGLTCHADGQYPDAGGSCE